MLRKCVSFGNLGSNFGFNDSTADIYGPTTADPIAPATTDGFSNISFVQDTNSQWVRLFVCWNFFWPFPPSPPKNPRTTPYSMPRPCACQKNMPNPPPCCYDASQMFFQRVDLLLNLYAAKYPGAGQQPRKVILTTIGYPKWVNGTHVRGTPYTEIVFDSRNFVIPPNNVLMLPTRKPPNRRSRFLPEDFMYFQWVNYLMNMLHPRNFASDAKINGKRVWIDAFELVNEPNLLPAALDGTRRYQSTALMMNTARQVKTQLNRKYGGGLKLLGPATAASSRAGGDKDYRRFTTALIDQLVSDNRGKPIVDRDFGWSHHNYEDVEQIGQTLGAGGRQAINTAAAALPPAAQQALARKAKKAMYGRSTQLVRDRLRGKWKGWIDPGDPEPGLFLTEGGCRIEHMPGFTADRPQPDPNAHYANGVKTSDPAAAQKRLQADSVGAAAEALKDRTKGVEMFTNFLFFDDTPLNFSGLCDHYAPARVQPPYARSSKVPQAPAPEPNESAKQYERPAYSNWKKFGL